MNEQKEFEGKDVDEAIEKACTYYNEGRDALELEILDGGSSGVFGLGSRKARVKARARMNLGKLESLIREVVGQLLTPIIGEPNLEVQTQKDPIYVSIQDCQDSGLVIGRDGRTISSLQYLANRILAKRWPERVRIQLDAGDYRERQTENLRKTALFLSKKARDSGRVQSTRPMSSYHRRVVHLALQNEQDINTRSKGDGPMKRVLIMPKRERKQPSSEEQQDN
jgi:spoIIIJ-associated protein